jgi:phosphate:Na+ symporter
MDVIRDLKRINGHITSVAYPILEAAGELADTRLKNAVRTENAIRAGVMSEIR